MCGSSEDTWSSGLRRPPRITIKDLMMAIFGVIFSPVHYMYIIYIFRGSYPPPPILPGAKFTFRSSLAFSYIGSLLHNTRAVGVSQTLRRGTRKGIAELSLLVCATYIPQGGHHVGHRPTFYLISVLSHFSRFYSF